MGHMHTRQMATANAAGPYSGSVHSLRHEAARMQSVSLFFTLLKTYFELESVTVKIRF